ncbi:hypothetical protein BIV57_08300, partial [Mangrovactinospora gilvigrisea]
DKETPEPAAEEGSDPEEAPPPPEDNAEAPETATEPGGGETDTDAPPPASDTADAPPPPEEEGGEAVNEETPEPTAAPEDDGAPDTEASEEPTPEPVNEDGDDAAEAPPPPEEESVPEPVNEDGAEDAPAAAETADPDEDPGANGPAEDPEKLHAFGNKEAPRPVRLDRDLGVDSPDAVVGPYEPTAPTDKARGASTYIDPERAPVTGQYHVLPPGYEMPEGLGVHADGEDVGGPEPWGHRTIYPTRAMTAGEFSDKVASLPWEHAGNKRKPKK